MDIYDDDFVFTSVIGRLILSTDDEKAKKNLKKSW